MKHYDAGVCDTTMTTRYETDCDCDTYPENMGVCRTWEAGGNGRCAYCDHEKGCHVITLTAKTGDCPICGNYYKQLARHITVLHDCAVVEAE